MRATYVIDLPTGYDETRAYPFVMAFHGSGVTAEEFRTAVNLAAITAADAIVLYPNGLNDASAWEVQRDVPLVAALLAKLKANYCIDEERVFALGEGVGSVLVNFLGCVLAEADHLRAIAPLSGAPPPPAPCVEQTAVCLMQGSADPGTMQATLANRDFWAGQNACDVRMELPATPSPCVEYAGCDVDYPVRYCKYTGYELPSFAVSGAWSFFSAL